MFFWEMVAYIPSFLWSCGFLRSYHGMTGEKGTDSNLLWTWGRNAWIKKPVVSFLLASFPKTEGPWRECASTKKNTWVYAWPIMFLANSGIRFKTIMMHHFLQLAPQKSWQLLEQQRFLPIMIPRLDSKILNTYWESTYSDTTIIWRIQTSMISTVTFFNSKLRIQT